jgi:glutathione S-transferase
MLAENPRPDVASFEHSRVTLVTFPPVWGRTVSPFALKLEAWITLAGIPFERRHETNPARGPKGKLPFLIDGDKRVADTSFIIEHLKRTRQIDPDGALSARQLAECIALQRLFEEHLYFAIAYTRWLDPEGRATMDQGLRTVVPWALRPLAGPVMRRRMRQVLDAQGLGRHGPAEIYALAREDLAAASLFLGRQPYFMGEEPCTIDAIAYGFLANILLVPIETELKRIAAGFANLQRYCERIEALLPRLMAPVPLGEAA